MEKSKVKQFFEHPDYQATSSYMKDVLTFLSPENNDLKTTEYLWLHSFEDPDRQIDVRDKDLSRADRALRELRTEYTNYLSMVAGRVISLIIKGGINFADDIKEVFDGIEDNVDGRNNNLETFFSEVFLDNIATGKGLTLVNTSTNETIDSLADEVSNPNARPYFMRLNPLAVKDWQKLSSGEYKIFRYEFEVLEDREDLGEEPFLTRYCEQWKRTKQGSVEIYIYKSANEQNKPINYYVSKPEKHANWILEDESVIDGINGIPLTTLESHAWLREVLPIAKKIYNKESELDNLIYSQGYDKTFISTDLSSATKDDGKPMSNEEKMVKVSHNSITIIPPDSTVIKLDPTNPEASFKSLADDKVALFQVAFNMLRVVPPDSKTGESADSRKEMKEDLLTRINQKRTEFISFVRKSINNFAKHKDLSSTYESKAEFSKPLEQGDISEFITYLRQISDITVNYPVWEKEIHKRLAQDMALPNEIEIIEDIESVDLEAKREEEQKALTEGITGLVNTKQKANKNKSKTK